jgi:hypothetical protein
MADAERNTLETLKTDPKVGEAHNNLAVVHMLTGRYPQADGEIAAAEKAGRLSQPAAQREDLKKARERP